MLQGNIICEEDILTSICSNLNEIVMKTLHINANFDFYGLKSEGYYTIHNKNKSFEDKRIDLNMRLYFDEKNKNERYFADGLCDSYRLWYRKFDTSRKEDYRKTHNRRLVSAVVG